MAKRTSGGAGAKSNARGIARLPQRSLIGMVHVRALPGTPFAPKADMRSWLDAVEKTAVNEARVLVDAGFDGVMIENMHDRPYVQPPHAPITVAAMTRVALAVKEAIGAAPLGVQVLSCGEREALSIGLAAGADWIRCENFVYAHVADEGLLERGAAGPLLRYRREIGAEKVSIVCDIKKKHASHAITSDISLGDAAHTAEYFGADGVIVTGQFTGEATDPDDIAEARGAVKVPVWVGSGVTPEQVPELWAHADALIVGSSIKKGGVWSNAIDPKRCRAIVRAGRG